jgi:CPA2 family monovalent cation:H+ antiporter-2
MTEGSILRDLVVLFAAALPIVFVFQRLNIPPVVGFLIAGVVIGPHGVGLIARSTEVDNLAELGLVLLLFVVGLELSFGQLTRLARVIVWSGSLQVLATAGLGAAAALAAGLNGAEAVLAGFLVAQSSTAIVLKVLSDRGELDAPHGRLAAGILLIQDLCLVPMVLLTRLLATPSSASWLAIGAVLVKGAATVGLIVVAARLVMPSLLRQIVRLRSRELFTGAIVLFCLGTAWLASQLGLSLALGALIAGLVISESEYSHQAVAEILPFRDAFNSIFFISIGMLVQLDVLYAHLLPVAAAAAGVLAFKLLVVPAVVLPFYRSVRVAVLTALALAGLGELSFVLARVAVASGLMPAAHYEAFVTVAVLTMLASPFLMNAAPALTAVLRGRSRVATPEAGSGHLLPRNQVLVVGYGLNGENLANVLRQTGVPYLILELNPERVEAARRRGEPVLYGDATRAAVLRQAGAASAPVIVVAISDPVATRRIVALARQSSPHAPIIVRTRYVAEIEDLRRLGATEVIPEEFETSVEIFARVLRRLHVPRNIIGVQIDLIRQQSYRMLRGLALPRQTLDQLGHILAATTTETFLIAPSSPAAGRSIRELKLRRTTGVTIIAVVRDGQPFTNPPPEFEIRSGDILVMLGSHAQLDQAMSRLGEAPGSEVPST